MALEVELETYENNLQGLLPDVGKQVVIRKKEILGIFDTYNDALKAGYDKCELEPFLVKKIEAVDQVQYFTRELDPCHT